MATATPSARRDPDGAEAARLVARAGRAAICRQDPSSEGAARTVSASVRRAYIPDASAASGPGPGTWKDPDPRRRSSRGSGGLRLGLPARQWRLRNACGLSRLNDLLALWSQAHLPSCSRQVTSTSVHRARPGPASASRGHAPLLAGTLSLARTISDRRLGALFPWLSGRRSLSADLPVRGCYRGTRCEPGCPRRKRSAVYRSVCSAGRGEWCHHVIAGMPGACWRALFEPGVRLTRRRDCGPRAP